MQYYFAPMEGLTDSIYRKLHHSYFPGVDRYYTPFFSPTIHRKLTPKEQRELPAADQIPYKLVPQILTKSAEDFRWMAQQCRDLGYSQVDLNLGCPSGTVTAKGKGSGMLRQPEELDRFLDCIFYHTPIQISVKTRLGFHDPEEFPGILEVLNQYPICQLTIHPRVRDAFYKGPVNRQAFAYALENAKMPLCYNGNIITKDQADAVTGVEAVMLGRGLIGDPGMVTPGGTTVKALEGFSEALLEGYTEAFGSARNAMFRMKENWRYWSCRFENSEKLYKRLRKTTDLQEYKAITWEFFHSLNLAPQLNADW